MLQGEQADEVVFARLDDSQAEMVIRGQDDARGRLPELHCLSKACLSRAT